MFENSKPKAHNEGLIAPCALQRARCSM